MAEIKQKIRPWQTPNFVTLEVPPRPRQEGFREAPSIPLTEVDAGSLSELCDEFRAEIFRKAGKPDPESPEQTEEAK